MADNAQLVDRAVPFARQNFEDIRQARDGRATPRSVGSRLEVHRRGIPVVQIRGLHLISVVGIGAGVPAGEHYLASHGTLPSTVMDRRLTPEHSLRSQPVD